MDDVNHDARTSTSKLPAVRGERATLTLLEAERPTSWAVRDAMTIGRDSVCDVVIADASVSRCHADLQLRGETWWIVDRDSVNGTWLGERRVSEAPLTDGDTVTVGQSTLAFSQARPAPRSTATEHVSARFSVPGSLHGNVSMAGRDSHQEIDQRRYDNRRWDQRRYDNRRWEQRTYDNRRQYNDWADPVGVAGSRGAARAVRVAGILISLVGMALWGVPIITAVLKMFQSLGTDVGDPSQPPAIFEEISTHFTRSAPLLMLGAGLLIGGMIVHMIGRGMGSRDERRWE
ncbi:MAG TPA: FHA domain-containing protein [Actinomycetota bacterium]|nr:FHA domain-containing protein [Actinomycetota bacterium]